MRRRTPYYKDIKMRPATHSTRRYILIVNRQFRNFFRLKRQPMKKAKRDHRWKVGNTEQLGRQIHKHWKLYKGTDNPWYSKYDGILMQRIGKSLRVVRRFKRLNRR